MRTLLHHVAPYVTGIKAERQQAILAAIQPVWNETLEKYTIDRPLRIAHFTAQIAHESDGFCATEEYASGSAYEGRADLGNYLPGDGKRFKGRGLIMVTGRFNYKWMEDETGLPLIAQPELAADPAISLRLACIYWQGRKLNRLADDDDIRTITKRINGGYNGLPDRRRYLEKAKEWLGSLPPADADAEALLTWAAYIKRGPSELHEPPAEAKPASWWARFANWTWRRWL